MLEHQMPAYYVIVNSCQTNLCLQTVTMLVNNSYLSFENERNKWLGQGNQKSSHEHSQHESDHECLKLR